MSTTYEILKSDGKERQLDWPSDEEAYLHIQMKFLNNYPKFFLPTICRKIDIHSIKKKYIPLKMTEYLQRNLIMKLLLMKQK